MITVSVNKAKQRKVEEMIRKGARRNKTKTKKAIAAAGLVMESVAARKAPVDTSTLQKSIRTTITDLGYAAETKTNVHYAKYQEFGTRFIEGKHFMKKGFDFGRLTFIKAMR